MSHFTEIRSDLFLYRDACNVYVLRRGERALLIDGGSGDVLDHLPEIGVTGVDWALFTHHHRDQCYGAPRFVEAGVSLAAPHHERHLFADVEQHWQSKRIWDNYNDRSTFDALGQDVPLATILKDYERFAWHDLSFEVVPAPGHTHGQVALVVDLAGERIAFTGDLMRDGGRLHQLHAMEYDYGDFVGVALTAAAIGQLRPRAPALACPSHGDVIDDPAGCMDGLEQRLRRLMDHMPYRTAPAAGQRFSCEVPLAPLSEHLLWSDDATCSNFYVIRADSGKALLIDYPYFSNSLFGQALHHGEPGFTLRFLEHHTDELRQRWGVTDIDVVIPTHIHDDHVCGIPYLQRHEKTKVWCLDAVAQVLETPERWNTPCLLEEPIPCDRIFTDGERFAWEGFSFEIVFYPGQTEFHAAILCENLDGRRVLFAGDSSYPLERYQAGATGWMVNTVMRNSLTFAMHRKCADEFERLRADFLCPGHGPVWDIPETAYAEHRDYVEQKEALWRDVLPAPALAGVDLFWARLLPYRLRLPSDPRSSGESADVELALRNPVEREATFRVRLTSAAPLDLPEAQEVTLTAEGSTTLIFRVGAGAVPAGPTRHLLCAQIDIDGQPRGPVIEALVTIEEEE